MQAKTRPGRPWRTLLIVIGGVLIIAVAALIVVSAALDPNKLRDDLQQAVRRQTGRELTVSGGVHLAFGLSPQFEVDGIALANLPGGSRPQMLQAKHLRATLALLPLLSGDAVISALTFDEPDILLERLPDGTPNWQFTPERRALYRAHGASGGGGSHRVEIRSLTLAGGQIAWRPAAGDPVTLGISHLRLSAEAEDAPMKLAFDGTMGRAPLSVTASSGSLQRLQGGPVSALAGAWPVTIDAASQDATLHVEGGIAHPDQLRGYQLRVRMAAPSLDSLNALLPKPVLPPLSDVNATALLADGSQGELRTSQLAMHAGASDLSSWVAGLTLKQAALTAPGPGQLAQLNVDGTYQNQPLRASATANQPDVVGTSGPIQMTLDAQAAGAALSAHGTMPPSLAGAGLDMVVSLHAPDLSALSPLVGHTLPPAQNFALDAQLGDAGVKLRGIAVRNLSVASSLGDATGDLTVVWSPRPTITGTLSARVLDLDGLAPGVANASLPSIWPPPTHAEQVAPAIETATVPPPQASVLQQGALNLAALRRGDIDLNVAAADMTLGGKHYTDLQAHLQLNDGKLALNPFRAEAPEGAIIGGASIDASSDDPPVAVSLRSPSIAAEAVAGALGYPQGATGIMQVDAQLSGTGQTVAALKASLDGHVGIAMVNGQVSDAMLQGLLGAALDTAGAQGFSGGTSQVRCFALRVAFDHGHGAIRALAADTSRLSLDGDGSVNLIDDTADLHLRPRIRLGPTEIAAPVSLRGPFGQMRATLDPVVGGNRYGISIGGAPERSTSCAARLASARGGLGGPIPAAPPAAASLLNDQGQLVIRKPKDLLQGLFH